MLDLRDGIGKGRGYGYKDLEGGKGFTRPGSP